jgi:site-specific DNA recombinase
VWKDLCEVLTHPENITDALQRAHGGQWLPQELKARRENLLKGRAALSRQLERLTEAYLGEVIPLAEYQRRRKDLEQRDEALAAQEQQLNAETDQRMELAGVANSIEEFCARVRGGLEDATFEQRCQLVELLVDRVVVADEDVEIWYVIPTHPESEQVRFCHLRTDYFRNPSLIGSLECGVLDEVWVDAIGMRRVSGWPEALLQLAQQRLFPHHTQHLLVVYAPSLALECLRHPALYT